MTSPSVAVGERERQELVADIKRVLKEASLGLTARYLLTRCRAALEASHAPVPREPTEAMLLAGWNAIFRWANGSDDGWNAAGIATWHAMYDAAAGTTPKPVKP